MADVQQALFGLACAIAGATLAFTWVLIRRKPKTQLVPIAKIVPGGKTVPNLSRAQRRQHKRRRR